MWVADVDRWCAIIVDNLKDVFKIVIFLLVCPKCFLLFLLT